MVATNEKNASIECIEIELEDKTSEAVPFLFLKSWSLARIASRLCCVPFRTRGYDTDRIQVNVSDKSAIFYATDCARIHAQRFDPIKVGPGVCLNRLLISPNFLRLANDVIPVDNIAFYIRRSPIVDDHLGIKAVGRQIEMPLFQGDFPPIGKFFNYTLKPTFAIDEPEHLAFMIKQVIAYAGHCEAAEFTVRDKMLSPKLMSQEDEFHSRSIDVETDTKKDVVFRLNPRYVLDAVSDLYFQRLYVHVGGKDDPVTLWTDDGFRAVIMQFKQTGEE